MAGMLLFCLTTCKCKPGTLQEVHKWLLNHWTNTESLMGSPKVNFRELCIHSWNKSCKSLQGPGE